MSQEISEPTERSPGKEEESNLWDTNQNPEQEDTREEPGSEGEEESEED